MADHQSKRGVRIAALAGIACFGLAAAGCSSSPSTAASGGSSASASASAKPTGTVNVAYASSLQFLNEKVVSPAFTKAEGYTFSGRGASSGDLEADIAGGEISPNVFESVGGDNITPLQPKFTNWYVQYAGTSMVVAYNPKQQVRQRVQGHRRRQQAALQPVQQRAADARPEARPHRPERRPAGPGLHLHAGTGPVLLPPAVGHRGQDPRYLGLRHGSSSQIYAESSLDSTLQAGQLDAASAFVTQATELHLAYIKLPDAISLGSFADAAAYKKATVKLENGKDKTGSPQVIDITTIGTPTPAGIAFVKYTLSRHGPGPVQGGRFHGADADGVR